MNVSYATRLRADENFESLVKDGHLEIARAYAWNWFIELSPAGIPHPDRPDVQKWLDRYNAVADLLETEKED